MYYRHIPNMQIWAVDSAKIRVEPSKNIFMARRRRVLIEKIDKELGTYHKCYSPMAKINVLNDLQKAITAWQRALPGADREPMAALLEVVESTLDFRPTGSRYNKAICIAYHTYCNYNKAAGSVYDDSRKNQDYFRHSENDVVDSQVKCNKLWRAITAASSAIGASGIADDDRTLKIFMAPEFYFRGRNGAYLPDIVYNLPERMRKLGTGAGNFQHWLFVFGTAVSAFEITEHYCGTCPGGASQVTFEQNTKAWTEKGRSKTTPKCSVNPAHRILTRTRGAEVQNVALIQHGNVVHAIAKEYISGIDYKANKVTMPDGKKTTKDLRTIAPLGGAMNPGNKPIQDDERLGGCIFTVDGVTVGLEVCLDHDLSDPGQAEYGRATNLAPTIQVLLIPSYGMSIGDGLHCKSGGIVFNVDGRGMGSSEVKINLLPYNSQPARNVGSNIHLYGPFNIPS